MCKNYSVMYYDDARDLAEYLAGNNGTIEKSTADASIFFDEKFRAKEGISVIPVLHVYKDEKLLSKIAYQEDGINPRADKRHAKTYAVKFGNMIKYAIRQRQMDLDELSECTGFERKKLIRIINGETHYTISQIMLILHELNFTIGMCDERTHSHEYFAPDQAED